MYETYFTPSLDESSPMGLLEVSVAGEESVHHNLAYANLIRQAIEASQINDPQARVIEAFYRGEGIPRELVDQVEPTVRELDVAQPVMRRLYELAEADSDPFIVPKIQELRSALETEALDGINYLTRDGLLVDPTSGGFTMPLLHNATRPHALDDEERTTAIRLGTEIYAFQNELVWQRGENGIARPLLLSPRQHFALGHLAADGTFVHVATALGRNHPARQTPNN